MMDMARQLWHVILSFRAKRGILDKDSYRAISFKISPSGRNDTSMASQGEGGLGKVHQLFGDKLNTIIEELNETLAA